MESKRCTKCGEIKALTEFYYRKKGNKYIVCKLCCNKQSKEYRQNNKEKISEKDKERNKKYYQSEKGKEVKRKYQQCNRKRCNEIHLKYMNKRNKTDISFRMVNLLRNHFRQVIKKEFKITSVTNLLGCTILEFKQYFKLKFTKGMTWDKFMISEIHIDHIIPCAAFDLTREVDQQVCFHYTNLQPLWALDNLRKSDKLPIDL